MTYEVTNENNRFNLLDETDRKRIQDVRDDAVRRVDSCMLREPGVQGAVGVLIHIDQDTETMTITGLNADQMEASMLIMHAASMVSSHLEAQLEASKLKPSEKQ